VLVTGRLPILKDVLSILLRHFFNISIQEDASKKKKWGSVNTHTVGIAKKHLLENFSIAREDFKWTHSMHLCFKM